MLQSISDTLGLRGIEVLDLRLSLLVVGLAFCLCRYVQQRREYEVNPELHLTRPNSNSNSAGRY